MRTFKRDISEVTNRGSDAFSKLFYGYEGRRLVHKWGHYLPIYSRLFAPYKEGFRDEAGTLRPVRFLEIGVSDGGSLELWRQYFGSDAILFGIDIDPRCAAFDGQGASVRIGSQADPAFLRSIVEEMGGIDIVLDDGSHRARDQRRTFEALFPLLSWNGLYVVEDLHTAYWPKFAGGYGRKGTFIEVAKQLVDDMHAWYHAKPRRYASPEMNVGSVQFFDSLVAIEKCRREEPFHVKVGPHV